MASLLVTPSYCGCPRGQRPKGRPIVHQQSPGPGVEEGSAEPINGIRSFAGAIIYMVLQDYLAKMSPEFWQFGIGALLVFTVMFARTGLFGIIESIGRRFGKGAKP